MAQLPSPQLPSPQLPSPDSPQADHAADAATNQPQQQRQRHSNVTVYQTTGPDAHLGPVHTSGAPALNPRSCVICRRRKVRCDKQMPCSNCRRALIPCVFPAPGRAPRKQQPRDQNAPPRNSSQREMELAKRLRKLEGIVEELSGQADAELRARQASVAAATPAPAQPSPSTSSQGRPPSRTTPISSDMSGGDGRPGSGNYDTAADHISASEMQMTFGRLVLDDQRGTSRYVSSGFWSRLNDELDAIREERQKLSGEEDEDDYDYDSDYERTPTESPPTVSTSNADHSCFVLGYRSADVDLRKCHPLPSHATFLWSAYQENVEPLIKLLHIPTMDIVLREARRNPAALSPAQEALVFSIYFAAITSLQPEEVAANFGTTRDDLRARHRFAAEQSLAKANFLDTSDVQVIQAFTLFLIVVRGHDESRFCWALTGLLIRIAQGLGLHRDGTHFKLSPYETEIRRRLWWAIVMLDLRSAEELGTDMTISDRTHDTQMPSNINDSDISPMSSEFPIPREGRSDCAVSLLRAEICSLSRRLVTAASAMAKPSADAEGSSIPERERMLIEVYHRVEHRFLQHVHDEQDPLYWAAAMIARIIMAKMCLIIYHPMLFPGSSHNLSDEIRQRLYVASIEVIEYCHRLNTAPRCKQYRWLFKTYTTWHAIAYTLVETCRRPWTALVERGWDAVICYDKDPAEVAKKADQAAVFLPIRKLFVRARRHRELEIARLRANPDEARKLEIGERMNPAQARFGPVPGAENKMDEMRERWRELVRPDAPDAGSMHPSSRPSSGLRGSPTSNSAPRHFRQPSRSLKPSTETLPAAMSATPSEAMGHVNELLAQPPDPILGQMWDLSANYSGKGFTTDLMSQPMNYPMPLADEQGLRPPALGYPPQQPSGSPFPWANTNQVFDPSFDANMNEDTDMLGEDFDWQDWSQSIRGLEMESNAAMVGNRQNF